jgi:hypothetical protein
MRAKGYTPVGSTPDASAEHILPELAERAAVVKLSGAKRE